MAGQSLTAITATTVIGGADLKFLEDAYAILSEDYSARAEGKTPPHAIEDLLAWLPNLNLVLNRLAQPASIPTYDVVQGPISLTYDRSPADSPIMRQIYIFGDEHHRLPACHKESDVTVSTNTVTIDKFLQIIVEANPKITIDFMLEASRTPLMRDSAESKYNRGYLFGETLKAWREHTYANLHVHFVDARFSSGARDLRAMMGDTLALYDLLYITYKSKQPLSAEHTASFHKIITRLVNVVKIHEAKERPNEFKEFDVNTILERTKTLKQIGAIQDPVLQATVYQFFVIDGFVAHRVSINTLQTFVTQMQSMDLTKPPPRDVVHYAADFADTMVRWLTWLMDAYTMGRLFRTFEDGATPQHVVMYVGDFHAERYRDFLAALKFQRVAGVASKDRCLSLTMFTQPFFST